MSETKINQIPLNIKTLCFINTNYSIKNVFLNLLTNLPDHIENIIYLSFDSNIKKVNNLPYLLKKLYVRNGTNNNNLKVPFGCEIIKLEFL